MDARKKGLRHGWRSIPGPSGIDTFAQNAWNFLHPGAEQPDGPAA